MSKKFKNWTQEEDAIMRAFYPQEGGQKIQERLPGKTLYNIYAYAAYFQIRYIRTGKPCPRTQEINLGPYTQHETMQVLEFYPEEGPGMNVRIPPRTRSSVQSKAHRMGVYCNRTKRWTPEERQLAVELVHVYGLKEAAKRLGRSYSSLTCYMSRHDYSVRKPQSEKQVKKSNRWRAEEDDVIRMYFPIEGGNCYKRLDGRSESAVKNRAYNMGLHCAEPLRRWTNEEETVLRFCMENKKGVAFCANLLGRSECAVRMQWSRISKATHASNILVAN